MHLRFKNASLKLHESHVWAWKNHLRALDRKKIPEKSTRYRRRDMETLAKWGHSK